MIVRVREGIVATAFVAAACGGSTISEEGGGTGATGPAGGTGGASETGGTGGAAATGGTAGTSAMGGGSVDYAECDTGHGGVAGAFFDPNQALCDSNTPMIVDVNGFAVTLPACSGAKAMCEVVPCAEATDPWYCCRGQTPQCSPCPAGTASAGTFCINQTEVTRAAYETWVASGPSVSSCTIEPDPSCMADLSVCGQDCSKHPQVCVPYCGADAFCASQGLALCSLWQLEAACGDAKYPYGHSYDSAACNGGDLLVGTTVAVGTMPSCASEAGLGLVYDLSGNVAEWTRCASWATGPCDVHGGSFEAGPDGLACGVSESAEPDSVAPNRGFRCCSRANP